MKNQRVKKVDLHVDIADMYKLFKYTQDDFFSQKDLPVTLAKLQEANIRVLGTTLYFDESFVRTNFYDGVNDFYHWYKKLLSTSNVLYPITRFNEINEESDRIACIYTIEGFQCLREPKDFDYFFDLGVRSFGLTWVGDNDYACGRHTKNDKGLSSKGIEVLKRMNNKPLIIDIAHLSERSVEDVAKNFDGMIVTTHGNVRSVHHSTHNLTDGEIEMIVGRGGVVSLFPLSCDTGKKGTFEEFYKHIEYIIEKWGEEHVAISSDIYPLDEYPFLEGYKDVLILNGIEDFLLGKMDRKLVEKIFYDNWLRVLKEVL